MKKLNILARDFYATKPNEKWAPLQVRKEALEKDIATQYPSAENKRIAKYYAQLETIAT